MHGNETDGVNNNKVAQLRPTSFSGVTRYWFRSLETNLKTMYKKESELFGGIVGDTSKKSKLILTISPQIYSTERFKYRPHRTNSGRLFGIEPNTEFKLHIQTYKQHESYFNRIVDCVELSFHLGGFGQRSRRGFGSIYLENIQSFSTPEQWLSHVKDLISTVSSAQFKLDNNKLIRQNNKPRINHPQLLSVYIGNSYNSADEALMHISETSSKIKSRFKSALGDIGRIGKKFSSPLIASVKLIGGKYYIVVSEVFSTKDIRNYKPAKTEFLRKVGAIK